MRPVVRGWVEVISKRCPFRFRDREAVIARDVHGTKVIVHKNVDGKTFDIQTDGRMLLTVQFAERLISQLTDYVDWQRARQR